MSLLDNADDTRCSDDDDTQQCDGRCAVRSMCGGSNNNEEDCSRIRAYVFEEQSRVVTTHSVTTSTVSTRQTIGGGGGGGLTLSASPSAFASPAGAGDPVRSNDPNGTLYLYGMGVFFESGDTLFVTNRRVLPTDVGYEYYRALAYDGIPRVEAVFVKDGGAVVPARESPLLKAHRDPSAFAALVEKEFDDIDSDVACRKNTWRGRELKRSGACGVMTTSTMTSLPSIVTQHDVSVTSVVRRAVVTRTQCASAAEAAADTARRQMCDNDDTSRCEDEEEEEEEGTRCSDEEEEDTEQQQADAACRRAECLEKEDTEEEEEEGKEEEEDIDTVTHDVVANDAAVRRVESDHLAEEREGRRVPVRLGDEEDDWTKKKKEDVLRAHGNTQCEYVQTPRSNVGQQMQTHNGSLCDHHARSTTSSSTENKGSILLLILLMVILLTTISFQIVMIMD